MSAQILTNTPCHKDTLVQRWCRRIAVATVVQKVLAAACVIALVLMGVYAAVAILCIKMRVLWVVIGTIGVAALVYVVYVLWYFSSQSVQRDILLIRKSYWLYVLLLVVAIPLVFMSVLLMTDYPTGQLYNQEKKITLDEDPNAHLLWSVYFHFIDPGNQHMTGLKGQWLAGVISIIGILLFNGLLVTTLLGWIEQRKDRWQRGKIRYSLRQLKQVNFAVVVGANEIASSVIKNLLRPVSNESMMDCICDQDNQYVILQTGTDVQEVRDVLASHLTQEDMDKVIIYNALRDSRKEIEYLHLEYATEIYILGENTTIDGGETYHDAMNMRCLNLMAEYLSKKKEKQPVHSSATSVFRRKLCRVLFDYQTTYSVFQFSDVSPDVNQTMVFVPFNRYESWARKVLVDHCAEDHGRRIDYTPLDGYEGIHADDDKHVHMVIVGMSKMGIAMGVQTLFQAHFPNYVINDNHKTRVTFIDTNADQEMAFFKGRYATLFELIKHRYIDADTCKTEHLNSSKVCGDSHATQGYKWVDPMLDEKAQWLHLSEKKQNFLDAEIEFVKGSLESDGVRAYLRQISQDDTAKLTIAICLTQTHQSVAASLYMPIEVYNSATLQQIWVYQREAADIVTNLSDRIVKDSSVRYQKLRPFGMLYGEYLDTRRRYLKATLVNMAYDKVVGQKAPWPIDMLNRDDAGRKYASDAWKNLLVCKKISSKCFVDILYQKLRSMMRLEPDYAVGGYNNPLFQDADFIITVSRAIQAHDGVMAQCEHNRWNMEKLLMGFSPIGKQEDDELRQWVVDGCVTDTEAFKKLKNGLKRSPLNIHPNICDFEHLERTDPWAKDFDRVLNNALAEILLIVDGYHTPAYWQWRKTNSNTLEESK